MREDEARRNFKIFIALLVLCENKIEANLFDFSPAISSASLCLSVAFEGGGRKGNEDDVFINDSKNVLL